MSSLLQIRLLARKDFAFALSLCRLAGWNQTRDDWQRLWALATEGCFVAEWEDEPVGTVTTTSYGTDLAWIGMMLVHPDHRRKRIGRALMKEALDHLRSKQVRCIKLDATPLGKKVYDQLGFREEWTFTRWACQRVGEVKGSPHFRVRRWRNADWEVLRQLDCAAFGVDRSRLLSRLHDGISRSLLDESPTGRINGSGFVRNGALAVYFGPLVATSLAAAGPLVKSLLAPLRGRAVFWDIPDAQEGMAEVAKQLGFAPQRQLTRMFLGENTCPGQPEKIFALAGPEVG